KADGDRLVLEGRVDGGKGMHYRAVAQIRADDASVADGKVDHADGVTILLAAATNYFGDDQLESRIDGHLTTAAKKDYATLLADHVTDYQKYFRRVTLDLGADPQAEQLSTEERVERVKT